MFKYVKKILSYFSPYKCRMLIISLCAVVNMVVSFFIPILSSKIVDDGLISKNFKIIVITSCALIGLYIVNSIFELILEKNRLFVYNNLHYDIERKAFNHLLSVKLSFFNNRNSTSISNMIVQDVSAVSTFVSANAFNVIIGLLSSISAAVSLFFMNWKLGIAVLLFIPINLIFSFIMTKMNTKTVEKYLEKYEHPLWKTYASESEKHGHGGMDYLVFSAFVESAMYDLEPPIDVYDAATWMPITCLSEQSIAMGSMPVPVPDFTNGMWIDRAPARRSRYNAEEICEEFFSDEEKGE